MSTVVLYFLALSFLIFKIELQSQFSPERWSVKQLVEYHRHLRPQMQVQDVYKMLYQANFGVEHILGDSSKARAHLLEELASMDTTNRSEPLLERISTEGEMVRINLSPFKAMHLDVELLLRTMFRSAAETRRDTLSFYREWNEFSALVQYELLNFPLKDVQALDQKVSAGDLQPVHHSAKYQEFYRPAYRIVRRQLFESAFTLKHTANP